MEICGHQKPELLCSSSEWPCSQIACSHDFVPDKGGFIPCRGWGEIGSKPTSQAQQPIGKPTLPAPIRPPGSQSTKPSMADLFKKKPAERESAVTQPVSSTLNQPPASSHSLGQGQESNLYSAPQESSSDANGWGPSHSLEPVNPLAVCFLTFSSCICTACNNSTVCLFLGIATPELSCCSTGGF